MKKPTEEECTERLHATASALAQAGASPYDIVTAFVDVALILAQGDPAYVHENLAVVADAFATGEALAQSLRATLIRAQEAS